MRVLFLITRSDTIGGAQTHVADLAEHLLGAGHEVRVAVGGTGPFMGVLRDRAVPSLPLRHLGQPVRPWADASAVAEVVRAVRAVGPDLVAAHSSKAGVVGRVAGRLAGVPVVYTAHGWAFSEDGRSAGAYRSVERLAAPLAARIITVSEYDRRLAIELGVARPARLTTVRNGVPDAGAPRADPAGGPPRLITVARLDRPKDFGTLLDALGRARRLAWSLDVVGDGPQTDEVRARADGLGLGGRVRLLGIRRDVPRLLSEAHLSLLISDKEGLPLTVLEAMRAGLPVVASDVGGTPEAVVEGYTGFLVPRGRADVLADRVTRLLEAPELRARMGEAGRARYEREFTAGRMFRETLAVYEQVVRESDARRPAAGVS